jgi:signal transduction histidine kinase/CheY-like chemotaxis protein
MKPGDCEALWKTILNKQVVRGELINKTKDGRLLNIEGSASPVLDEHGNIIGFLAIQRDITERKQAEEERRELERRAHLASRLAAVGEMAAGIAHEINNPLTAVVGFADLVMARKLPEDVRKDLEIINESARRVGDIVRRLLTFARQYRPERSLININEVIENTLQMRAYELVTGNIKVSTELDPDLPVTMADGGQLQQVFLNLIINAEYEMRSAHEGGKLLIKTERMDNTIRISFKDDGPGIPRENLERIFEPFFTTKKVGEGTGLGLSLCHSIITEHKGGIYADSELGKGATFIVELPVVGEEKEVKPAEVVAGEAKPAVKAKILVVDDEPAITQFLSRVLTDEGYEVKTTDNAETALKLIERERYSLILLDIKLPGMNGFELYQHLDQMDKPLTPRVVFITGDVLGTDTKNFLSRTNASYITKPFNIEQLKEEINRILSHGE